MGSTVEAFATKAAQLSCADFVDDMHALGVFVRLDERGGDDEPAPWAFHNAKHVPQTVAPTAPRDDAAVDAEALRAALKEESGKNPALVAGPDPNLFDDDGSGYDAETVTRTYDGRLRLPVPPARGAATIVVIPHGASKSVGRQDDADVVIAERSISKCHAHIETESDGTLTVIDAASRNGTRINGRKVKAKKRVPLRPGDIVVFGDVMCLFLSPELLHQHVATFMD